MTQDIFVPQSSSDDALVQQLHTVTYVTSDKDAVERAFLEGYDLKTSGWRSPSLSERGLWNRYFGFSGKDWQYCCFFAEGAGANINIRVFYDPYPRPCVRAEYDGLLEGGATISFPKTDLHAHEKHMAEVGFKSTIGVKELEFQSPKGEVYTSAEIIYYAPENVYLLAVKRPEIFVPVGPSDPDTGVAGPAYSARCVDRADDILAFLRSVLGFEIRRDVILPIGEKSALLLPEGTEERFIQAFAPGASTGYLVLMDHMKDNKPSSVPNLGTPNRGIVMWSFQTKDIDEVFKRAGTANTEIIHAPAKFSSPFLSGKRSLLMKDPGGFMIEVFET